MKNLQERMDTLPEVHRRPTICSVMVVRGEPSENNPFRAIREGISVIGEERKEALRRFRDTGEMGEYTFWDLRAASDVIQRRIEDPTLVNWLHMSS